MDSNTYNNYIYLLNNWIMRNVSKDPSLQEVREVLKNEFLETSEEVVASVYQLFHIE